MRRALAIGAVLLTFAATSCGHHPAADGVAATHRPVVPPTAPPLTPQARPPELPPTPDLPAVSALVDKAIATHELPGAVVWVGHGGKVVFHRAYGARKLPGEQGLDGAPAPAEPMTEDTIFDLASLTKPLATTTAVMQLVEQGKVQVDDPVQEYLPDFNPANDPERAQVTVRMLLTHTSGEHPDVELRDPWGLARADRAEGFRRALTNPLASRPGEVFRYSDINFIVLGALLEKVTGEPEDVYVQQHIFDPLGMADTRYLPVDKACGPHTTRGSTVGWAPGPAAQACPAGTWNTDVLPRIAPTAIDDEGRPDLRANPDLNHLLRGAVHDTTTRRMGGVAGHAGVFSTAGDVGIFVQALLDRLAGRPSNFPLKRETVELMTTPQQPGRTGEQVGAANAATQAAKPNARDPLLASRYPAIAGQNLRGFGWDIDTGYSQARGKAFPIGSFGHTGFTGTTLWVDPASDSYVILLSNAIHQRGSTPINRLRGDVATTAAQALGLDAAPR